MKKQCKYYGKRLIGYVIGFMLFYAPFDGFARLVDLLIPPTQMYSIHEPCFRIPLNTLVTGDIMQAGPVSLIALALLVVVSLVFGPLYCGKLCPAGVLPEFLSRLVPEKLQIDWSHHVRITPIRYGFLAGFFLTPLAGIVAHCAYCNFFVFDMLITVLHTGRLPVYSISLILTFVLWFIVLGLFTKGGRGFCNFLCPVGAFSSVLYQIGRHLPWSWQMKADAQRCVGCQSCQRVCPMRTIVMTGEKAVIDRQRCIVCGACRDVCPVQAITYGTQKEISHE